MVYLQCDWCGRTLRETESSKVRSKVNPCTNETTNYTLCDYCNVFPSKESMEFYKGLLVNWALLNIPITLDSISQTCVQTGGDFNPVDFNSVDFYCGSSEWTVTLNITVKYSGETIVRKGWVA
jgi:hypothetical protein